MSRPSILLTGATGYVGGRLMKRLERDGYPIRCMVRNPENLIHRASESTEVLRGDVADRESLKRAMTGIDTAFYLIHAMGSNRDFEEQDRVHAQQFVEVAREMGVRRIVYLGGLGSADELSPHLRSRQEVGAIIRNSGVQGLEFRASIVIGSGSLSFELIRGLVHRLPIMITPKWVRTKSQPIAIDDVIDYLVAALAYDGTGSRVFEIGGSDQVSYGDLMMELAHQRGLRRFMIPVPFLTLKLSSYWLALVTPLYARIGRKMIDSVRHETVVRDSSARDTFPVEPRGYREAIAMALDQDEQKVLQTHWSDAVSSAGRVTSWGGLRMGNRIVDSRRALVAASPAEAFTPIRKIGGKVGWYYGNWLWRMRGLIDSLVGGVGIRRGRRDPERPQIGDALDFWRVTDYEEDRYLLLAAEMKVPGRAWLHFEIKPLTGGVEIRQTAIFDPAGLWGLAYWYMLYPVHRFVFKGMLDGIIAAIPSERPTVEGRATPESVREQRSRTSALMAERTMGTVA